MNDVLKKVSDTVSNEPIIITVDIKPGKWWQFKQKKKVFSITNITLGSLIHIGGLLVSIDKSVFDPKNLLESNYKAMDKYGHTLAEIVAIAIHNKKGGPSRSLITFVETNFTAIELYNVMGVVIKQMDVSSFMSTIISAKGLNILESQDVNVKVA